MGGYKIINQDGLHFITCTVVGWVDVFTRKIYRDIIIESLAYCISNKGLIVHGYVIMSNHIHLIVRANEGFKISDILRDFKKYTSKEILKLIIGSNVESRQEWMLRLFKYFAKYNKNNTHYQLWKRDNKPIELATPKWINQKLDYIHNNPVNAGLVNAPEDYVYSSASNYYKGEGILKVELFDIHVDIGYIDT